MDIGGLKKRITFIAMEEVENNLGLTELKPVEKLKCWAKIEPARGREYYEAQKIRTENTYKITVRFHHGIKESMLIKYDDRTFEIQNIVDPCEAHISLEFYCTEKSRGMGVPT